MAAGGDADEAARPPEGISLESHRDNPHVVERGIRWATVGVLVVLAVAGLANVFGQRHDETTVRGDGATLTVSAPAALRSGLYFQGRFVVAAERTLEQPVLVLDRGWFDAVTVNTIEPEPETSTSEDGHVSFAFAPLRVGRTLTVYVELQVNPTTFGRRHQGVELRDGNRTIATVERSVTIFP